MLNFHEPKIGDVVVLSHNNAKGKVTQERFQLIEGIDQIMILEDGKSHAYGWSIDGFGKDWNFSK